jgi:uncharacterized protein involved in exopolysaccharide biosynthesis
MVEERPLPWGEWLEVLFRRRRWILGALALGVGYALLSILLQPDLYRAKARILLTAQAVPNVRDEAMPLQQIRAEIALMTSPKLIRSVLESRAAEADGGVGSDGEPLAPVNPLPGIGLRFLPPPASIDSMASALSKRIVAEPVQGTNLVDIAMTDPNPVWAADFVNDLLEHHVRRIGDMAEQAEAQGFYSEQRELLAERWSEARAKLSQFRERQGPALLAADEKHFLAVVTGIESQLVASQTLALELEARVRYLRDEIARHPPHIASESRVTQDQSVAMLQERVLDLEIERSELLSRYTPQSTLVRDLDRRLEEARRLLASKEGDTLAEELTAINPSYQALEVDILQTEASLNAARARIAALQQQLGKYRGDLVAFEDVSAEFERLQAEVDSAQEAHGSYSRQQEAARLSSAISESGIVNVSVIETADVPTEALPSAAQNVLLFWTAIGLVLGVLAAIVRDLIDPTIQSSRRTARVTGLPVVSRVPSA